jgi:hypothetical protein
VNLQVLEKLRQRFAVLQGMTSVSFSKKKSRRNYFLENENPYVRRKRHHTRESVRLFVSVGYICLQTLVKCEPVKIEEPRGIKCARLVNVIINKMDASYINI